MHGRITRLDANYKNLDQGMALQTNISLSSMPNSLYESLYGYTSAIFKTLKIFLNFQNF